MLRARADLVGSLLRPPEGNWLEVVMDGEMHRLSVGNRPPVTAERLEARVREAPTRAVRA